MRDVPERGPTPLLFVILAAILLVCLAGAIATSAEPALPPRPADAPPVYSLPPDERVPSALHLAADVEAVDYGHGLLNVPAAWKVGQGKGIKVAVLDTGCAANHKDLKDQIAAAKDFTGSRSGTDDKNGHGTHCAGVVAAARNDWGLVGVAPESRLLVGKVLGDDGSGSVLWIADGIDWAVSQGADVISMSLGGAGTDKYIPPALARAEAAGVIVVAAAGNDGPAEGTIGYPGGYAQALAVAAVGPDRAVARFSSRGHALFAAGPGVNVRSCYPGPGDGVFATMSGTSMACPHVAGLAALWVAAHPEVAKKERPAKFRAALQAACKDLGPVGRDTAYGWGLPDAAQLAATGAPPPPPVDPPKGFTGSLIYRDGSLVEVRPGK